MKYHSSKLDVEQLQKTDPSWYKGAFKIFVESNGVQGERILPLEKRDIVKAFNLNDDEANILKYLLRYKHKYPTRKGQIRDVLKLMTYASFLIKDLGKDTTKLIETICECESDNEKEVSK
jgi:hypothetical protein